MLEELQFIFYGLGGLVSLGIIVGLFKALDWLISLKYQTKDTCEKCRKSMFETMNTDRNLLVEVDTKVSMILEYIELKRKGG